MPLKLHRKPGSQAWYVRGTVNGKRFDESTSTPKLEEAQDYLVKRSHELQQERLFGKAVSATFAQAAVHYLEHGGSKRYLRSVLVELAEVRLSDIGQERVDQCAKKLYPGASPSTRNRQVYTPVLAVLKGAARMKWCSKPVIARPVAPPGRIRWLTKWEAQHLVCVSSPHMRPLLEFLLYTGARVGEALWLTWKHVDLERNTVTFVRTKNGQARSVPLHPVLRDVLARMDHSSPVVFPRPDGLPYAPLDPLKPEAHSAGTRIKTGFQAACRRAGLTDLHPHDLRHTWATWHYQANRDLGALTRLGGWKTTAMVMRYAHTNVDELADTIERL